MRRLRLWGGVALGLGLGSTTACWSPPEIPSADALGVATHDPVTPLCSEPSLPAVAIDTLARGLEVPWAVAFLPDGGALLTERPGRIRAFDPEGRMDPEPWAELTGLASEEVGLMGIDTRITGDGRLQVYVAAAVDHTAGSPPVRLLKAVARRASRLLSPSWGQPRSLRIVRYDPDAETGAASGGDVIAEVVPEGSLHGGGALAFGPDDHLYLTNGDGADPALTLRSDWWGGKLLRFTPAGVPAPLDPGDPVPVVVRGIRNSQAIAWHPDSGEILLLEHGPSGMINDGGRVANDELNVARPGDDLGWPVVAGASEGGGFRSPEVEWSPAIAPAGMAVSWDSESPWGRGALVTGLLDGRLRMVRLSDAPPTQALCEEQLLDRGLGRLRLVALAPDGSIWVGTSNRDGRGGPRPDDDLLLRLRPLQLTGAQTDSNAGNERRRSPRSNP